MFKCGLCKRTVEKGVSPFRVVAETRQVQYSNPSREAGKPPTISKGSEIVREVNLCSLCSSSVEFNIH